MDAKVVISPKHYLMAAKIWGFTVWPIGVYMYQYVFCQFNK
jgi:hypothetical protein